MGVIEGEVGEANIGVREVDVDRGEDKRAQGRVHGEGRGNSS